MHTLKSAVSAVGLIVAVCWLTPTPASADCKCSNLKLVHAGHTGILCSDNNLNFLKTECTQYKGSDKGCNQAYAYDCNLGVNSEKPGNKKPYQKAGFLSTATLTKESNVDDCHTGQLLQMTIKSNDKVDENPFINPTSIEGMQKVGGRDVFVGNDAKLRFPQIDAKVEGGEPWFGGDNYKDYKSNQVLFFYDGGAHQLNWWDNPDQTKDSQSEKASWQFAFVSFVNGTAENDSCACAFDIKVEWPAGKNNKPTTTWTYNAGGSKNCTW